ncbi:MAG: riboflavin biosynthesis protein RibF [Chitinispirillaceae bacterium]|nr:riboflavin biosynthesis protein RibF [Chitinispirillaceae bacterium]
MRLLQPGDRLGDGTTTVVSVGNFDGVHKGHRYLIDKVVQRAQKRGCMSVLVTFDPHPRLVLNPEMPFEILTTFDEKVRLIEPLNVDRLLCIPFTAAFSRLSPEDFIEKVMIQQIHAVEWVMGEDHGVGKDRSGEKNFLHNVMSKYHITPFIADLLEQQQRVVSSTQIRVNITDGRIVEAVEMLGHPYLISTERIPGVNIGSQLGFPTLNFIRPPSQKVLPPAGVYAAELEFKGLLQTGALYFGECPTFADRTTHFEFHAFDEGGTFPEYGEEARLRLHRFVRKDRAFPTTRELSAQIDDDVKTVRNFFMEEKGHAINKRA